MPGCPIRKSADHIVCANPRSLSQLITSFFASKSLGIPHTPFVTFSIFPICTQFNSTLTSCQWTWWPCFLANKLIMLAQLYSVYWLKVSVVIKEDIELLLPKIFKQTLLFVLVNNSHMVVIQLKWAYVDSNHGPLHYQCSALTSWAISPLETHKSLTSLIKE